MLQLRRTNSDSPDFRELVSHLDHDLALRDGEEHAFYAQFNKIDKIKHALVAYQNEEAVACGAIRPLEEGVMEVKRMFVLPEFRGQGIAAAVLKALEEWSAELGYHCCRLETGKKQPEAIQLYTKAGYKLIPNYGQYAGVENSVCMEKEVLEC